MAKKLIQIPSFIKAFGTEFFSYVLNISQSEADLLLKGKFCLKNTQETVLKEIIKESLAIRKKCIEEINPDYRLNEILMSYLVDNEKHVLNYWKEKAGYVFPEINDENLIVRKFKEIGIQAYPAKIFKDKFHERPFFHFLFKTKTYKELTQLVFEDSILGKLFNSVGKTSMDTYCICSTSTGIGGSLQQINFVRHVLFKAYYLMCIKGKNSIEDYLESIEDTLRFLKEIAENKKTKVPCLLGFLNVTVPADTIKEDPFGKIRNIDLNLGSILPPNIKKQGFVFEMEQDFAFEFRHDEQFNWPKETDESIKMINKTIQEIKLSVLLGCEKMPHVRIIDTFEIVFDPLSDGFNYSWRSESIKHIQDYECDELDLERIFQWLNVIRETDNSNIQIAIRRLISAASERINPVDSFIDAIIAWENLFGGESGAGISFRISSAITCLLEKEKLKRKDFHKKIKDAYNLRSKIVHGSGSKEISYEDAQEKRDFAIDIGLKCISKLYKEYPELIKEKDRAAAIILGAI